MVGSTPATMASPTLASSAPVETSDIATPKATRPTAPAVNAGPSAAAPRASPAIAATMPTIHPIASGPAFARLTAASDNTAIPAAAIRTAAPKAMNPVAPAVIAGATFLATTIKPATATVMPISTPAASGPACAICTAEYAKRENPAAINATPAPIATNAFADSTIVPDDSLLAVPTAFSPAATPNNLPASVAIPFPVMLTIAPAKVLTPGATALTILKPLKATYNFGNSVIAFATSLS